MSESDFWFACEGENSAEGPWQTLKVVSFEGHEEMSRPFTYELYLLAGRGVDQPDPRDLVGRRASLRIRTESDPQYRVVHGVVVEAEDVNDVPEGALYRVVLAPPWIFAAHRIQSRIFLEKTLRQIVDAVLTGDKLTLAAGAEVEADVGSPQFKPADELFTWRIKDSSRVDDARVRAYTVQYNESDFAFVSRLLEEEGVAYHYEHGDETCLLVLSDSDAGRPRAGNVGAKLLGRRIDSFRLGGQLRAGAITFGDYNWKKPGLTLEAKAEAGAADPTLEAFFYPGGFPDNGEQGKLLAEGVADRNKVEAEGAFGEGTVRVLGAGSIFELEHTKERFVGEYLVTAATFHGEQAGVISVASAKSLFENVPFRVAITCARRGKGSDVTDSRFRPAHATARPRIWGAQTAFVTAEGPTSSAEVHVGGPDALDVGCVRVKFHWDTEHGRHAKQATSTWIRVNEPFAGPGQGGVWHPQVGVEVIVEYEEGNPDRPIITGRVYNGANLPSHGGAPTISTLKSFSTPGHGVHNELTFDDSAGSELFYINAGKDMTSDVGNDRNENITLHATMQVGSDNSETIGSNNSDTVGANDSMVIGANQVKSVGANRTRSVGANRTKLVGAAETRVVGGNFESNVSATLTETTGGAVTETYSATKTMTVSASLELTCGGSKTTNVSGAVTQGYGGNQTVTAGGARTITVNGMEGVLVGGDVTHDYGASWTRNVSGPMIGLVGGGVTHNVAGSFTINAPINLQITLLDVSAYGAHIHSIGSSTAITGVSLTATGAQATYTGSMRSVTGLAVGVTGNRIYSNPLKATLSGIDLRIGMHIFV